VRGGPVVVTWDLSRCGGRACVFCDQELGAGGDWATLAACERIVGELSEWGTLVVSFAGGNDPFLHPDLPAIVARVSQAHLPVLTSAGWGVTSERARAVWDAGLVEAVVQLDSADAAEHDARIGQPGSHARALRALRTLVETRRHPWQRVNVSVTLGVAGTVAVEAVIDLVEALGVAVIVEPPARNDGVAVPAGMSAGLVKLKRRRAVLRNSAAYLSRVDQALDGGVGGCKAGRRSLHVDQRGRVFRCADLRTASDLVGDLEAEDARAILGRLRQRAVAGGCAACWRPSRGEVECLGSWRGLWNMSSWLWS
jgi:MoaA/NifB/PqqE/SkfB family radical SAM enzyme